MNTRLPITDKAGLKQALEDANLPSLLMVYVQYTHDEPYLKEFEPTVPRQSFWVGEL